MILGQILKREASGGSETDVTGGGNELFVKKNMSGRTMRAVDANICDTSDSKSHKSKARKWAFDGKLD